MTYAGLAREVYSIHVGHSSHDMHCVLDYIAIKAAQLCQMPQPYPDTEVQLQRSSESKCVIII